MVLDMATTVAAYGKVKAKAQRGEADAAGLDDRSPGPAADGPQARRGGLPAADRRLQGLRSGAHRGLAGRHAQRRGHGPRRDRLQPRRHQHHQHRAGCHGHRFERLRRCRAISRPASTGWCATCRASERMPGVERIWLPGEQSHERRATNERDGIPLSAVLHRQLQDFAREIGIPALETIDTTKETT